jgi:hypothetical protein
MLAALSSKLVWGAGRLAFKYLFVPAAFAVGTVVLAGAAARKMRERVADINAALAPAQSAPDS